MVEKFNQLIIDVGAGVKLIRPTFLLFPSLYFAMTGDASGHNRIDV